MKAIRLSLFLILLMSGPMVFMTSPANASDPVTLNSISIQGEVRDNYVNITTTIDVSANSDDSLIDLDFKVPDNLFLSNISIISEEITYWGTVKEIQQAQDEYDDAVQNNQTAVLIKSLGENNFHLEANIKANLDVQVSLYVEGVLLRHKSKYQLDFLQINMATQLPTSLDLDLISTNSDFRKIKVEGLTGISTTQLTNGYNLAFDQVLPAKLSSSIIYESTYTDISNFMTYTNGTDNYFVYQLAPEIYNVEEQMPKSYVFVIDTSGSMDINSRLDNAKIAFNAVISTLNSNDYFNVISFSTSTQNIWSSLRVANSTNIDSAKSWVNNLVASGGTNINDALLDALSMVTNDDNRAKSITFLSDGDPSEGVRDLPTIIKNVREANTIDAPIFVIALDSATNEQFMESIAFQSKGNFAQINSGSNVVAELLNFYEGFSTPVTTGMQVSFTNAVEVAPNKIPVSAIFNGSEVLIAGKFTDDLTISTVLEFANVNQTISSSINIGDVNQDNPHLEVLWAVHRIQELYQLYSVDPSYYGDLRATIIDLSVKYGIVVEGLTAMILVVYQEGEDHSDSNDPDVNAPPVENIFETLGGATGVQYLPIFIAIIIPVLYRKTQGKRRN